METIKRKPWYLIIVVIAIWLVGGLLLWILRDITDCKMQFLGLYGDSFGVVSALFAGLALACLVWTIILQHNELELQRKALCGQAAQFTSQNNTLSKQFDELKRQRKALEEQSEQLSVHNRALQRQNFERSFFQLLGLHGEIASSIEFNTTENNQSVKYRGRNYFIYMFKQLTSGTSYEDFFAQHQLHISHYFRQLYNIVKFVDKAEIPEKESYIDLIHAQLSTNELGSLFFHGLHAPGGDLKNLIERYALLKDVRSELPKEHVDLYAASAYGEHK